MRPSLISVMIVFPADNTPADKYNKRFLREWNLLPQKLYYQIHETYTRSNWTICNLLIIFTMKLTIIWFGFFVRKKRETVNLLIKCYEYCAPLHYLLGTYKLLKPMNIGTRKISFVKFYNIEST